MPEYDANLLSPPAPLAHVLLRNRDTGAAWADVPMLIDSGADVTLVPRAALGHLGATAAPDRRYELVAFDGRTSEAEIVILELVFCRRTFRGQFVLADQAYGVLGRNILNAVPLLLDGPRLAWTEHLAAPSP